MVRRLDVKCGEHIVIGRAVRAEQTRGRGAGVGEVTTSIFHEWIQVFGASGSTGRDDRDELMLSAVNIITTNS